MMNNTQQTFSQETMWIIGGVALVTALVVALAWFGGKKPTKTWMDTLKRPFIWMWESFDEASTAGKILAILVILALIGGIIYYFYNKRDSVQGVMQPQVRGRRRRDYDSLSQDEVRAPRRAPTKDTRGFWSRMTGRTSSRSRAR